MRRKVLPPDLWEKFGWQRHSYHFKNNLYFNAHVFNVLTFFSVCFLLGLFLAWWNTEFLALSFSLLIYCLYAWLRTRKVANGLRIKRICGKKGYELQVFDVHYEISNESGFELSPFSFTESFTGTQKGTFLVNITKSISPQTRIRITEKVHLDAGMGVKEMGGFTVRISDELNLFPFRIEFSGNAEVEVFPVIIETPQLVKSISPDSTEFGYYDVNKRGDSNLFIGTREYRHGDPVKYINWKLSKKTSKIIVNEFEKTSNTYVTLLLDLELSSQVGLGAFSTWEAAKDLALSIAANEVRQRNYIQVLAQDLCIPFATGPSQLMTLERHFTYHEFSKSGLGHLRHLENLPSQSQIYFFCPLLATTPVKETLETLKRLRMLGHRVTVFGIDPFLEMTKAVIGEASVPLQMITQVSRKDFERITADLIVHDIDYVHIEVKKSVSLKEMMIRHARHLLEEKPS